LPIQINENENDDDGLGVEENDATKLSMEHYFPDEYDQYREGDLFFI